MCLHLREENKNANIFFFFFFSTWTEVFLLHFSNTNSLITDCTHSEEGDTSSTSVNKVIQSRLWGRESANWTQAVSAQRAHVQNAGIKSTQLMPWRVNTTHTMGVDVIDKTVGGGGGGVHWHKITGLEWTFQSLEDMQSHPRETLWSLAALEKCAEKSHCKYNWSRLF